MKSARTRHSALSLLVSISVAGTVFAATPNATIADDFPDDCLGASGFERSASSTVLAGLGLGDLVCAGGMVFCLPEGAVEASELGLGGLDVPAWVAQDGSLFVASVPAVATGVNDLRLGDLIAAATDLALAMGGEVVGFSVYDNAEATVYVYDVAFSRAGVALVGSIGFVAPGDGTLTALTCIYAREDRAALSAVLGELYASVDMAA